MAHNTLQNVVRKYLASQHMLVDEDWLSGCVDYLSEENNLDEANIKTLAREQWLLNDLKDICPGSLPAGLKTQAKTVLNGRYVLQINAAIDIGTPAYQQYLKLQKVNMENVEATTKFEEKISSHRMIKLYLTDGVQEITAIEYKTMRNISCDLTPGCKALFKGPIECRRGMLLLNESSIELLGGEVQEIAVSHSLAGLISSKLGLPISQEPDPNQTLSHPRNTAIPTPHTQMPPPSDGERPVARVTSLQLAELEDDIDLEQIDSIEAQMLDVDKETNDVIVIEDRRKIGDGRTHVDDRKNDGLEIFGSTSGVKRVTGVINNTAKGNRFNNIEIIDNSITKRSDNQFTGSFNRNDETDSSSKRTLPETLSNQNKKPKTGVISVNNPEDYPEDNDLFFEDEDYLKEIEAKFDQTENYSYSRNKKYPSEPFIYIKQINAMNERDRAGKVFRIKAQIMKLLSKLSVGKDGWSLKCTLVDGSGSIDVDFTNEVLSKLVGYTPQEMNQLKKQMAGNPDLKQKAVAALQKAKDTLQVLYCVIELTMLEVPKITNLIRFDATHVQQLDRRLASS